MARTVEDAAILLDAMAGFDPADPTSIASTPDGGPWGGRAPLEASAQAVRSLRVGVAGEFLGEKAAPTVAARVRDALHVLHPLVAGVEEIALPLLKEIVAAWWTICLAEASAYH